MDIKHFDKKILKPSDRFGASNDKSVRGFVIVENEKGVRKGENLVVLGGREFLASKLVNLESPAAANLPKYEIRYFGIGKGGASDDGSGNLTVKNGPYANDTDLYDPLQISQANSADGVTYVDNGYLKYILADSDLGSGIVFESETHTVETADGTVDVDAYTIIKFTMFIREDEMTDQKPFEFNEAGLWAVEYDADGNLIVNSDGTVNKRLFAHFTTSSKFIEATDQLKIEWYILV